MRAAQFGKGKRPKAPDASFAFRGLGGAFDATPHVVTASKLRVAYGQANSKSDPKAATGTYKLTAAKKEVSLKGNKLDHLAYETQQVRADASLWGQRAVALAGPNAALPARRVKYRPPRVALYADGTTGAPVTLRRDHKSAYWVDGVRVDQGKRYTKDGLKPFENIIVTKPYTVVKSSHRGAKVL
jgi:hypothetical protein